jgi:AAHS family 4-hydroxybenzoate transporter-like MFS transporter
MRGTVLNVMICGINIGGAIGGFSAAKLIPVYGWQFVFYVGGILPVILAPLFMLWLPESVRFLVLRQRPKERIVKTVRRIDSRLSIDNRTEFAVRDVQLTGMPVRHLFAKGWAIATVLLWLTMFMNQIMIAFYTQYMPTMLNAFGLAMASAVMAAGVFQLGAVLGTLLVGPLIDRFGYFKVLAALYIGAGAFSMLMVSFGLSLPVILVFAFATGICVSGGQNTANGLSGAFYPTLVRSTGSGWGLGIGRLGGVTGPALAGMLLAFQWPVSSIFYALGIPSICAAIAVLLMSRQALRSPEIRQVRALESTAPAARGAAH